MEFYDRVMIILDGMLIIYLALYKAFVQMRKLKI